MTARPARPPFLAVPGWLYERPELRSSATVLRVYVAVLAAAGNQKSRISRAGWKHIAEDTGLSRSCIYRDLATLRDFGAIRDRPDGTFWLPLDDPADAFGESTPVDSESTPVDSESTPVDKQSTPVDCTLLIENSDKDHRYPAAVAAAPPKPTERDPVKQHAHRLAVLAMEQPVKPVVRGESNPFMAVMAMIERELRAGRPVGDIHRAVEAGVDVWTAQGLRTAIAQNRTRPRPADQGDAALRNYLETRKP